MGKKQVHYERPLPLEIDDASDPVYYDQEIIDYLNNPSETRITPAFSKSEFSVVRRHDWYLERFQNLKFKPKDIWADLSFSDILSHYREFLVHSSTEALDKSLLRCELRQTLTGHHKLLAHQTQDYFDSHIDYYEYHRSPPRGNRRHSIRVSNDPLIFQNEPTVRIFKRVANEALFDGKGQKFRKAVDEYRRENAVSRLNIYDFLPSSFLIGRIWAIKTISHHWMDNYYHDFYDSVAVIDTTNRQVHSDLRYPANYHSECSYYQLHGTLSCILDDERSLQQHDLNQKARSELNKIRYQD